MRAPRPLAAVLAGVAAACVSSPGHLDPSTAEEPLTLAVSALSAPPRGAVSFTARGGSGGYRYTVTLNRSGATIDPGSGSYVAGPNAGVSDEVQVEDSEGHTASRGVDVGAGVAVSPPAVGMAPAGGPLSFGARGGSGAGFVWACAPCGSGGSVDPSSGLYQPGGVGDVNDVVQATDSLGNVGTARVNVGNVIVEPPSVTLVPGASRNFAGFVTTEMDVDVMWEVVEGAAGGAISSSWPHVYPNLAGCVYVAPSTPGTYHLRATSVVNPAKSRLAEIVVAAGP
jgi:hypothetical protein